MENNHFNDDDRASIIRVINGVFIAEHSAEQKLHLADKLKAKKITPDEYVEAVADEFMQLYP